MSALQAINLSHYNQMLTRMEPMRMEGEVVEVVGLVIESRGPAAAFGDFCEVRTRGGRSIRTQVIGFRNGRVLSMALEEIDGLSLGDRYCLALARREGVPALTAERRWPEIADAAGVTVRLIR